jgi:hypothetical protein
MSIRILQPRSLKPPYWPFERTRTDPAWAWFWEACICCVVFPSFGYTGNVEGVGDLVTGIKGRQRVRLHGDGFWEYGALHRWEANDYDSSWDVEEGSIIGRFLLNSAPSDYNQLLSFQFWVSAADNEGWGIRYLSGDLEWYNQHNSDGVSTTIDASIGYPYRAMWGIRFDDTDADLFKDGIEVVSNDAKRGSVWAGDSRKKLDLCYQPNNTNVRGDFLYLFNRRLTNQEFYAVYLDPYGPMRETEEFVAMAIAVGGEGPLIGGSLLDGGPLLKGRLVR